jgi:hypothetical protein
MHYAVVSPYKPGVPSVSTIRRRVKKNSNRASGYLTSAYSKSSNSCIKNMFTCKPKSTHKKTQPRPQKKKVKRVKKMVSTANLDLNLELEEKSSVKATCGKHFVRKYKNFQVNESPFCRQKIAHSNIHLYRSPELKRPGNCFAEKVRAKPESTKTINIELGEIDIDDDSSSSKGISTNYSSPTCTRIKKLGMDDLYYTTSTDSQSNCEDLKWEEEEMAYSIQTPKISSYSRTMRVKTNLRPRVSDYNMPSSAQIHLNIDESQEFSNTVKIRSTRLNSSDMNFEDFTSVFRNTFTQGEKTTPACTPKVLMTNTDSEIKKLQTQIEQKLTLVENLQEGISEQEKVNSDLLKRLTDLALCSLV